jgi:hypothetical protein
LPRSSTATGTTAEVDAARPAGNLLRPRGARGIQGALCALAHRSACTSAHCWLPPAAGWTPAPPGGEWLLRIEDLDPPREPPGAAERHPARRWTAFRPVVGRRGAWFQSRRQAKPMRRRLQALLSAAGMGLPLQSAAASRHRGGQRDALGRPAATCATQVPAARLPPGKGVRTRASSGCAPSAETLTDGMTGCRALNCSQVLEKRCRRLRRCFGGRAT